MKYIVLVFVAILFGACSSKEVVVEKNTKEEKPSKNIEISDLIYIPQDVEFFTKDLNSTKKIYKIQKKYEKYYFNVWNNSKPRESVEEVKWPFYSYRVGGSYGENFELLKQSFFDEMLENANFSEYATLNKKAITLREVNIRAFPTIKPLLRDPTIAGEGFPFDYLQNSTLHANKPLFVSHYSKDKEWVYVFSSFTSGWIKSSEMVFLSQKHVDAWQKAQQVFFIKENIPFYSKDGTFLFHSKIGMMLAIISEDENKYEALAISSYKNTKAMFQRVEISKSIATKDVLSLNKEALTNIMSEMFKSNYGWGGIYGQRDCSSMLRDLYAPFGIWLPRNSSQQAKVGKIISLKHLNNEEKIKTIKEKAVPFETLLYKKGHIVLYVGIFNGEIIVFHNIWGIKTNEEGREGRVVVGKAIFSTLKVGSNIDDFDKESEILKNLQSMNILTQ
ncbi:SH3 domain-containing C40 family peptidase [Sulfurimonas sp.]|uniref:SH3 domain-containing C40 family peptidase n=1 Tax=Sulfurimonas sp. TaxID=2022749 RepID=UPI002B48CA00|nr:SH3 domain-containing protein [Sulfurimonas sp.]